MFGYIYLVTNLINEKKYIGKHESEVFDPSYNGSGKILWRAYKKYGIENFSTEVIEWCKTEVELNEKEKHWIKELDTFLKNGKGYNIASGGNGGWLLSGYPEEKLKEYSKKMSQSTSGEKNGFYGKTHSIKTRQKLSLNWERKPEGEKKKIREKISLSNKGINSGKNNPMYGINIYDGKSDKEIKQIKEKISISSKKAWTPEKRKQMSLRMQGVNNMANMTEDELKEWKRKIGESQRKRIAENGNSMEGRNHSNESRMKMSRNHADFSGGKHPRARTIIVSDENKKELYRFDTLVECCKELKINKATIRRRLDKDEQFKGLYFSYS